jgi:hypothetical protein
MGGVIAKAPLSIGGDNTTENSPLIERGSARFRSETKTPAFRGKRSVPSSSKRFSFGPPGLGR